MSKSLHQIQAQKVLADLEDAYFEGLEQDCVDYGHYEEIGQGHREFVIDEPYLSFSDNISSMLSSLGYENKNEQMSFIEWFLEYYYTDKQPSWVTEWSKAMAVTFYEIIKEMKERK